MYIKKTLLETNKFPNGEVKAVLYDNNDEVVRIVELDDDMQPILSDKEREALDSELKDFNTENPIIAHRNAVARQRGDVKNVEKKYMKKMYEIFKDIDVEDFAEEIAERVSERLSGRNESLQKGLLTNLLGIGAIASMLPNKEQERLERLADKEMERAERVRRHNNRKFRKALGGR